MYRHFQVGFPHSQNEAIWSKMKARIRMYQKTSAKACCTSGGISKPCNQAYCEKDSLHTGNI